MKSKQLKSIFFILILAISFYSDISFQIPQRKQRKFKRVLNSRKNKNKSKTKDIKEVFYIFLRGPEAAKTLKPADKVSKFVAVVFGILVGLFPSIEKIRTMLSKDPKNNIFAKFLDCFGKRGWFEKHWFIANGIVPEVPSEDTQEETPVPEEIDDTVEEIQDADIIQEDQLDEIVEITKKYKRTNMIIGQIEYILKMLNQPFNLIISQSTQWNKFYQQLSAFLTDLSNLVIANKKNLKLYDNPDENRLLNGVLIRLLYPKNPNKKNYLDDNYFINIFKQLNLSSNMFSMQNLIGVFPFQATRGHEVVLDDFDNQYKYLIRIKFAFGELMSMFRDDYSSPILQEIYQTQKVTRNRGDTDIPEDIVDIPPKKIKDEIPEQQKEIADNLESNDNKKSSIRKIFSSIFNCLKCLWNFLVEELMGIKETFKNGKAIYTEVKGVVKGDNMHGTEVEHAKGTAAKIFDFLVGIAGEGLKKIISILFGTVIRLYKIGKILYELWKGRKDKFFTWWENWGKLIANIVHLVLNALGINPFPARRLHRIRKVLKHIKKLKE